MVAVCNEAKWIEKSKRILSTKFTLEIVEKGDLGSRLGWSESGSASKKGGNDYTLCFFII